MSGFPIGQSTILYDLAGNENSKMVASKPEVYTHISACRHDRNTISKAISMSLRSGFPIGQSTIFYDLAGSENSKMVASKPEV